MIDSLFLYESQGSSCQTSYGTGFIPVEIGFCTTPIPISGATCIVQKPVNHRDKPGGEWMFACWRAIRSFRGSRAFIAAACFFVATVAMAQETVEVRSKPVEQKPLEPNLASIELFQREASEYEITLKNGRKAELNATPVFKWANDVKNNQDGALFAWMQDDRPQVLGCVFTYYYQGQERRKHQFHSLATEGLSAAVDGAPVWQPASSGLTFTTLPSAGNPETDPAKLKLQLRRLSRRFSAELEEEKGGSSELRLIPTPLLTYSPKKSDCLAGGVFAFATGTDPDLLLVLEAKNTNDQLAWNYAFARFHYGRLTGKLDGVQVWQAPAEWAMKTDRRENSAFRESSYVSFRTK